MSRVNAPGRLVGSGRYADVYDIGRGRVLRRYRDSSAMAGREAEVMRHARAHGVPVPEVFAVSGTDIVMEYARRPSMLQVLTRRPWTLGHHARLLADLHALVHAVPVLGWLRAPFGAGPALLHLDLHPGLAASAPPGLGR
jgi:aminoglycoside phosphotransferase (APT) family kinase protein